MKRTLTILMGTSLALSQPLLAQTLTRERARSGAGGTAVTTEEQAATAARAATPDVRTTTTPRTTMRAAPAQSQTAATARTDLLRSNTAPTSTSSRPASRSTSDSREYVRSDRRYDNDRRDRDDWDGDDRRSGNWSRYRYSRPPSYVHGKWDRGRTYWWNNHRWHWHGGTWVIFDASPGYYTDYAVSGRSMVAQVQRELQREGYNPGPADGVAGTKTRRAIAAFQRDHGLRVTGQINSSLLRALDIA